MRNHSSQPAFSQNAQRRAYSSSQSSAPPAKAAPCSLKRRADVFASDRGNVKVPKIVVKDHWATATYIIVIWGPNLMHILEALVVGMALKRTSTRRRICYVSDVPRQTQLLLNTVWEHQTVRPFRSEFDEENGRIKAAVKCVFQATGMVMVSRRGRGGYHAGY